jgi:hypothetical protein
MILSVRRSAYVLSALAITLCSCGDYVESSVRMHLQVSVTSLDGRPISQAAIWMKDLKTEKQPISLQKPVCTTNSEGKCSTEIRYSFGYIDHFWDQYLGSKPSLPDRFELSVKKEDHLLAQQMIHHLLLLRFKEYRRSQ